ncbi:putative quinol monooxygenase [Agarivorans sp. MS3-6]|uniref:putative quinol monooxygenase n=1 Tax=Agarivorans sp. TSD2052 TaxID=2937286 RepID=UPI00200F9808|nr:putative quinol monooxygenase [Agarivorans sp. TSD2052]UPW17039.1 antibiotic biosynthesis monooxygenase [Agarivorans sp. TSD2052]
MSKKIYCIAMFKPKAGKLNQLFEVLQGLEPNTLREDGCIQYTLTRQIDNPFATGTGYPIAFQEIWADKDSFEAHCQRQEIKDFFQAQCVAESGFVEDANVCVYSDEPENYDAPVLVK